LRPGTPTPEHHGPDTDFWKTESGNQERPSTMILDTTVSLGRPKQGRPRKLALK